MPTLHHDSSDAGTLSRAHHLSSRRTRPDRVRLASTEAYFCHVPPWWLSNCRRPWKRPTKAVARLPQMSVVVIPERGKIRSAPLTFPWSRADPFVEAVRSAQRSAQNIVSRTRDTRQTAPAGHLSGAIFGRIHRHGAVCGGIPRSSEPTERPKSKRTRRPCRGSSRGPIR